MHSLCGLRKIHPKIKGQYIGCFKGGCILEYVRFASKVIMRIDKGEEIVAMLRNFCAEHKIKLASVSAIGAVNKVSIGIFNQDTKEYHPSEFFGNMEIVSLMGTITQMQG